MYKQFVNSTSSCALFMLVCDYEWACVGGVGPRRNLCVWVYTGGSWVVFVFRVGVEGGCICVGGPSALSVVPVSSRPSTLST